jgi:hypothetical protein
MSFKRYCKHPGCMGDVPYSSRHGGYCSGKAQHWNDPELSYWKPKCECGAQALKTKANPTPVHSDWCPYEIYLKGG